MSPKRELQINRFSETIIELDKFPAYQFGHIEESNLWFVENEEADWIWLDSAIFRDEIDLGYGKGVVGLFKEGELFDKEDFQTLITILETIEEQKNGV